MCYTGTCPYEYNLPDGDTGCRKPRGCPCPMDEEVEDEERDRDE